MRGYDSFAIRLIVSHLFCFSPNAISTPRGYSPLCSWWVVCGAQRGKKDGPGYQSPNDGQDIWLSGIKESEMALTSVCSLKGFSTSKASGAMARARLISEIGAAVQKIRGSSAVRG